MKVLFVTCPYCSKKWYAETIVFENRLPLHCPGCDAYLNYDVYSQQMAPAGASALTRIRKPLNEKTVPEILYIPKKTRAGSKR
jgi:hypothetical protein